MRKLNLLLLIFVTSFLSQIVFAQADWVHFDSNGKLVYKKDAKGNRVMDFSTAGYMGGGVALPNVGVKATVNAGSGDMTSAIQSAIDKVSAMPLENGFRGAVLLGSGTFNISSTINIKASGVVLRGSGSGSGGTVINTNIPLAINISGSGSYQTSNSVNVQGDYIPSGATTFTVSDASNYNVGDPVLVYRTVTDAWLHYVGMDNLVRDGEKQTWIAAGTKITTDRYIKSISGNTITLDAPLTDSYDATYLGRPVATMAKYSFPGRISQVGLERLKIQCPKGTTRYNAIDVDKVINGWIRDVVCQEHQNTISIEKQVKQFTLYKVVTNNTTVQTNGAPAAFFGLTGTQILMEDCKSTGMGLWGVSSGSTGTGPIVVLNYTCDDRGVTPHMRWTTGFLADGGVMTGGSKDGNIRWENRRTAGSGHGWATAWSVAWNVTTAYYVCDAAPGTYNWFIGGKGTQVIESQPVGISDHVGTMLQPTSLYRQQLLERLGHSLTTSTVGEGTVSPSKGTFMPGTTVSLKATPALGWKFSGWSGDLTGTTNPVTITMNSNKTIKATFAPVDTWYKIKVVNNPTFVINSVSSTLSNGTNVNMYTSNSSDQQLWKLVDVGNGYVKIVNKINPDFCLDCSAVPANGVNVQLWSYVGNTRQQWLVTDLGNGTKKITVRYNENFGLDCSATPANNVNLQMWTYVGNNRQQWILEQVLKSTDSEETEKPAVTNKLSVECTPNPIEEKATLNFIIPEGGKTKLIVYNSFGQPVKLLTDSYLEAGKYSIPVSASELPGGVYVIKLISGAKETNQKIIIR